MHEATQTWAGLAKRAWRVLGANGAPLLGFLGTIVGMVIAFRSIGLAGEVEATWVAGGIAVALAATVVGLLIAIRVNIVK